MTRTLPMLVALVTAAPLAAADKVTYDDHVKPIFRARCFTCHNLDKKSGGLDLTNYTALMQGGSSGEVVEAGDADLSYLWLLVNHESEPYMPPKSAKIPDKELATIRAWINGGLLENAGSKAKVSNKPKFDLALAGAPTGRPKTPPLPWRLPLQPVVHTKQVDTVTAVATNPWSNLAAVAGQHQVLLYDTKTTKLLGVLPFPEGRAQVLRFSRNGALLLAGGGRGGDSGKGVLWNTRTGERVAEVGDEYDEVLAADISADQRLVALGGPDRIVRVYEIATGKLVYALKKHTEWIYALEFSPDGVLLATADRNGGVHVWEAYTGREYLTLNGHKGGVNSVSWRIDGNLLATASADATVKLWEMENGQAVKSWSAHGGGVESVEFARDGRLVSCGRDKVTKLWDQAGKQLRAFPAFGDIALRATICDETNRVIAGDWAGVVHVWNAADGAHVGDLALNPPMLEQKLQSAEVAVAAVEKEYQALDAAVKAAEATLAKQTAAHKAETVKLATATQAVAAATAALNAAKQEMARQTTAKGMAGEKVTALGAVAPLVVEAHAKLAAAATKAPADAELKTLVAQAKAKSDKTQGELATARKAVNAADAALTAANKAIADANAAITKGNTDAAAAKKAADTLAVAVKVETENLAKARAAVQPVATKRAAALKTRDDLRQAIAFQKEVAALEAKRAERRPFENKVAEATAKSEDATAKVATATSEMQAAQKALATADANAKAAAARLSTATAEHAKGTARLAALEKAVPALTVAAAKAKEALAAVPGDATLTKVVASLQAEIDGKSKSVADTKTSVAAMAANLAKLRQEKSTVDAALATAKKQVDAKVVAIGTATKSAATMKGELDKARAELATFDQALGQVEARVQALRAPAAAEPDPNARADASKG